MTSETQDSVRTSKCRPGRSQWGDRRVSGTRGWLSVSHVCRVTCPVAETAVSVHTTTTSRTGIRLAAHRPMFWKPSVWWQRSAASSHRTSVTRPSCIRPDSRSETCANSRYITVYGVNIGNIGPTSAGHFAKILNSFVAHLPNIVTADISFIVKYPCHKQHKWR